MFHVVIIISPNPSPSWTFPIPHVPHFLSPKQAPLYHHLLHTASSKQIVISLRKFIHRSEHHKSLYQFQSKDLLQEGLGCWFQILAILSIFEDRTVIIEAMASEDDSTRKQLEELQKQLGKKQTFEGAVASIKSLLIENYASSSASTRKLFYSAVCRVATVLRTRYTTPGYLIAGLRLFEEAERAVTDAAERKHVRGLIEGLRKELNQDEEMGERNGGLGGGRGGYLFEGHLTVDPEPPQPAWLMHQNLVASLAATAESSQQGSNGGAAATPENLGTLLQGLIESMEDAIPEFLDDNGATTGRKAPPASKDAVAKLPVIKVNQDVLIKVGEDAECAICKEKLVVGDEMQELPCKHTFHPPCLKPWLDEHNSCPICRHELPTDDHAYESWKEREKELEEERRGAANALRGGEFMYV